jgi:hypothetical protein
MGQPKIQDNEKSFRLPSPVFNYPETPNYPLPLDGGGLGWG